MGFRILYIALILLILPVSCNEETVDDCFSKKGPEATITRLLQDDFDQIEIGDRFDVVLVQDSGKANTIELSGPTNVLSGVVTEVVNGKLEIRDENSCKWIRQLGKRIPVTIYFWKIKYIYLKETASLQSNGEIKSPQLVIDQFSTQKMDINVNLGTCDLNHRSQGEVNLKGYIAVFVPSIFDSGLINARDLKGDYIFVYHYGINEIKVTPFKVLECHIENKGNVYYYADPVESFRKFGGGPGQVIRSH